VLSDLNGRFAVGEVDPHASAAGLTIAMVGTGTAGAGGAGDVPEIRTAVSGASSF